MELQKQKKEFLKEKERYFEREIVRKKILREREKESERLWEGEKERGILKSSVIEREILRERKKEILS